MTSFLGDGWDKNGDVRECKGVCSESFFSCFIHIFILLVFGNIERRKRDVGVLVNWTLLFFSEGTGPTKKADAGVEAWIVSLARCKCLRRRVELSS